MVAVMMLAVMVGRVVGVKVEMVVGVRVRVGVVAVKAMLNVVPGTEGETEEAEAAGVVVASMVVGDWVGEEHQEWVRVTEVVVVKPSLHLLVVLVLALWHLEKAPVLEKEEEVVTAVMTMVAGAAVRSRAKVKGVVVMLR